ncbi:hypothetical protein HGB25_02460 [Candidatus Saccharibacteria bacterium]|nr:hypothetical protein [Candidatus Saccharibacteria bacterium]
MPVDLFVLVSCCSAIIALALILVARDPLAPGKRRFLFLSMSLIAWAVFNFLADNASGDLTLFTQLTFLGGISAVYFMMNFMRHYPNSIQSLHKSYIAFNLFTALVVPLVFLPHFIVSVGDNTTSAMETSFLYDIFIAYIVFSFILMLATVRAQYKKSNSAAQRSQVWIVSFGFIVYAVLAVGSNVVLPLLANSWVSSRFGPIFTLVFVGIIFYAIVKHQLFDIRLAIVRSVTYSLVLVTFAGIYFAVAYVISMVFNTGETSVAQAVSGVSTSLLLVFIFQPIKRFFDRVTNKIFYKDNYDTDEFYARLNRTLAQTTDLRKLLERTSYEIGTTLKSEQAFFFLNVNSKHFLSAGTVNHRQMPRADADKLGDYKVDKHGVIVASSLEAKDPIRRLMVSHKIELVLPLVQDGVKIGYLCLGDHLNSNYTNRDIRALNTISNELIIAIQNALAVQEIREINESLQQRINLATKELRANNAVLRQLDKVKDEFIGMASHQLRTPLTSVKGYLSMVIEGDAGKITPTQKKLLDQAFSSSENMVHLINDFLNVSRIQTGKFVIEKTAVDLSELVRQEVASLQPNAKMRNMKLVYDQPKGFPLIDLDEGKIRQVVMNFSDNAIYYSHENTSILISLAVDGKDAVFTVKDTGIGVPVHDRAKLFSKFFRATNAKVKRPDGTGVGLYLAKKVIDALNGEIIFESTEGKGSTFGFRLPIVHDESGAGNDADQLDNNNNNGQNNSADN